jgi:hypothetical protein
MLGGCTIETAGEARTMTAAMRAHPAAWSPRDMDPAPFAVGDDVELEPCVGPLWAQSHGQPCPRVELWPENALAAHIAMAALSPAHLRGLYPAYVEALVQDVPGDEAVVAVRRAWHVLHSPAVMSQVLPPLPLGGGAT